MAVRWYLRYGLSYRDVEELLAERGVEVDHVTVYRWVQRFTPLFADAARPLRHVAGDRWFVDETYVKVSGRWRYLYRAVDQYGQVIDVLAVRAAGHRRRSPVLHPGAGVRAGAGRGDHRQGRPVPAGPGRTGPSRRARHRAVRQQPDRSRSQPAKGPATADARTQTPPVGRPDRRRPRASCRTSAAATTNSPPTPHHAFASRQPSPSSLWRSELDTWVSRCMPGPPERNRAPGRWLRRPSLLVLGDLRSQT